MDLVTLIARLLLAGVFVASGVAKLFDLTGSRQAVVAFGVPERLAALAGVALPVVELGVAVALLLPVTVWRGSLVGGALLLAFSLAVAVQLVRGHRPDCHCFGQIGATPIGPDTLARNAVFLVLAALVAVRGPAHASSIPNLSVNGWIVIGGVLAALAILSIQAWLLLYFMRQYGKLLIRVQALEAGGVDNGAGQTAAGPAVGEPAPDFDLLDLRREHVGLQDLRRPGNPVLLVFADPGCGPCGRLFPELADWQRSHANSLTISIISRGPAELNQMTQSKHGLSLVLLQEGNEVAESYGAIGTPAAILLGAGGRVESRLALGSDAIRALMLQALDRRDAVVPHQLPVPEPVQ